MNIVSTVIVLILVIAVVCGIIHSIRKDRKKALAFVAETVQNVRAVINEEGACLFLFFY